jgi:glycosyltransferase involved in cell wall biosynthesis
MARFNKTDSSLRLLMMLSAFWSTVLLVRILEVWLAAVGIIPGITIRGRHVHHFVIGFALIVLSSLLRKDMKEARSLLMGAGLGLMTDEFLFWTMLEFDYWSLKNLLAIVATGTVLVVLYQRKRSVEYVALGEFADLGSGRRHENPTAPQVSVVIPAYNEEQMLPLSLAAIANQDFTDFEVIVVDNGCTDRTAIVARECGARVIRENRRGVAHARQAGFLSATGAIIATTDADTIVPCNWLNRIVRGFAEDDTLVAMGGLYRFYSGPPLLKTFFPKIAHHLWRLDKRIMGGWSLVGCNMAVAKGAFLKVGGFNRELHLCEDADLAHRLGTIGNVALKRDLVVATSGRRYRNGLMSGLATYAPNLLSLYLLKKRKFNRLPPVRQELPSRVSLIARIGVSTLVLVCVFSYGNPALARTRRSMVAHSKQAVTRIESIGHKSLTKHLRGDH